MGIMKKTFSVSGAIMRIVIGAGAAALLILGLKKKLGNKPQPVILEKKESNRKN